MKKILYVLLSLVLLIYLSGCTGTGNGPVQSGDNVKSEISPAQQADENSDLKNFSQDMNDMGELLKEDEFEGIDDF